jgi:aspartyl-tRNA(Asn)/glutamyl-tRNA(Gln) amidotransferase subunit B
LADPAGWFRHHRRQSDFVAEVRAKLQLIVWFRRRAVKSSGDKANLQSVIDLLPLQFSEAYVAGLKAGLPELPDQKKLRFIADLGLTPYDAGVLVAEHESAYFYEAVLAALADKKRDGKLAANWVINELFGRLNQEGLDIAASPVSAIQLGAIVDLIGEGTISGKIAKDLFEIVWQEGGDPRALVEARGMKQVTDIAAIEKVVDDIIAANPDKVA